MKYFLKKPLMFAYLMFLVVTFSVAYADTEHNDTWQFLVQSTTHMGESPSKPGIGWLALRQYQGVWSLTKTDVKAKKTKSEITDYDIEISSSNKDAIALFKSSLLTEDPVATPKSSDGDLSISFQEVAGNISSKTIFFNKQQYVFSVVKKLLVVASENQPAIYTYPLVVQSGTSYTEVGESEAGQSEDAVRITWMGDLDRDGKLDLIFHTQSENSDGFCVLLSSNTKKNKLFGKKLCHIGSGC